MRRQERRAHLTEAGRDAAEARNILRFVVRMLARAPPEWEQDLLRQSIEGYLQGGAERRSDWPSGVREDALLCGTCGEIPRRCRCT